MLLTAVSPWVPTLQVLIACVGFALTPIFAKGFLVSPGSFFVFCFAYTFFRALFQLPWLLTSSPGRISRSSWKFLLVFGLIGGGVRMTELAGISLGVPISEVGFLIYSHPIWAIALGILLYREWPNLSKLLRASLCLAGVAILSLNATAGGISTLAVFFPVLCSFLIACWICLSKHLGMHGVPIVLSGFIYDAAASVVIFLVAITQMDFILFVDQLRDLLTGPMLFTLIACSLLTGVVPNLLFYRGVKRLSVMASALILTLEPLVTALAAFLIWSERPSALLYWAGALILLGNVPYTSKRAQPVPKLVPNRKPVLAAGGSTPGH